MKGPLTLAASVRATAGEHTLALAASHRAKERSWEPQKSLLSGGGDPTGAEEEEGEPEEEGEEEDPEDEEEVDPSRTPRSTRASSAAATSLLASPAASETILR